VHLLAFYKSYTPN